MKKNATLLITGGTGSFGNAVLDKFLDSDISEIRILSRDEKKQHDMRVVYNNPKIKFLIGDVRDKQSLVSAIKGVDYIFHAAALKQVPSCEFFPLEAVKTNVIGTDNVLSVAIENNVKKIICLSTDKAVYPINAMGTSKAMMEKVFVAKSRISDSTIICGTRYGNVMASRGSVIPHFYDQIKSGKEITVTDPNMTRFMMTLDDAVKLSMFAFENGNAGDIFIQKSPSTTIGELASTMKKIYNSSVKIRNIGIRHAEKIHETLLTREERLVAEELDHYFRVPSDNRDLNYNKFFFEGKQSKDLVDYNSFNTNRLSEKELYQSIGKYWIQMKILIIGADGMIGHKMAQSLSYFDLYLNSRFNSDYLQEYFPNSTHSNFDFLNQKVEVLLNKIIPDYIINAVGITIRRGASDNKETNFINSQLSHKIDFWCMENQKKQIYFSTDCVFSGDKGNYYDYDLPDAKDYYGISKAKGEINSNNTLTIRSSMIGREVYNKTELLEWVISNKNKKIKGFDNAVYSGVTTFWMSYVVNEIIRNFPELSGLYNISSHLFQSMI